MASPSDYREEKGWASKSFTQIVTDAVADVAEFGFDSESRIQVWSERLKQAALRSLVPQATLERTLKQSLTVQYNRTVKTQIPKQHKKIPRFTIERLEPKMRAELDRRVMLSASLIKLNRERSIEHTLQRFAGWASSVPPSGVIDSSKSVIKTDIKKAITQLPFEERRVLIDQGHKMTAAVNNIVAQGGGAIAMIWHSHAGEIGYQFRPDHKARNDKVYILKNTWATEQGFVSPGENGYYEDSDMVAQLPFCRCYAEYLYALSDIPDEMLTKKGHEKLQEVRKAMSL